MLIFVYTFWLASGQPIITELEAHDNWKPVRKMSVCKELARAQELRLRHSIKNGNGMFIDVQIKCERRKHHRGKKR